MDAPRSGSWPVTALIVAVFAVLYSLLWWDGLPGAIHLVGAERVLGGEVPYRDFWTIYAPGSFYALAGLFALTGPSAAASAFAGAGLSALAIGALHRFLRRVAPGGAAAALGAASVGAVLLGTGHYRSLNTYPPTLLAAALGLGAYARAVRKGGRGALLGAGLGAGVAALFKHDVGFYAALAMGLGLLAGGAPRTDGTGRARLGPAALLGVGAALPVAFVAALLVPAAGPDLWRDLIVFPATEFPATRWESYPPLVPEGLWAPGPGLLERAFAAGRALTFALPVLAAAGGALAVALAGRRRAPHALSLAVTFALGLALHRNAAAVQINTHIVSMTLYGVAFGVLGFAARAPAPSPSRRTGRLAAMAAAGWLLAVSAEPLWSLFWALQARAERVVLEGPRLGGIALHAGDVRDLERLRELVDRRAPPGTPIYVGEHRHDMVVANDVRLYFALGRPSATRYQELHPGVANTAEVQAEMIRDLERQRVPVVIRRRRFDDAVVDAALERLRRGMPRAGATVLDAYLDRVYVPLAQVGRFEVLRRREPGAEPPAGSSPAPPPSDASGARPPRAR